MSFRDYKDVKQSSYKVHFYADAPVSYIHERKEEAREVVARTIYDTLLMHDMPLIVDVHETTRQVDELMSEIRITYNLTSVEIIED